MRGINHFNLLRNQWAMDTFSDEELWVHVLEGKRRNTLLKLQKAKKKQSKTQLHKNIVEIDKKIKYYKLLKSFKD